MSFCKFQSIWTENYIHLLPIQVFSAEELFPRAFRALQELLFAELQLLWASAPPLPRSVGFREVASFPMRPWGVTLPALRLGCPRACWEL